MASNDEIIELMNENTKLKEEVERKKDWLPLSEGSPCKTTYYACDCQNKAVRELLADARVTEIIIKYSDILEAQLKEYERLVEDLHQTREYHKKHGAYPNEIDINIKALRTISMGGEK